jgi:hypothetical protein
MAHMDMDMDHMGPTQRKLAQTASSEARACYSPCVRATFIQRSKYSDWSVRCFSSEISSLQVEELDPGVVVLANQRHDAVPELLH